MAFSAVGTLVLTVVLALSTVALWKETKRLAVGAESQATDFKKSLKATRRNAAAARRQAKIAKDTLEIPNRAYLIVNPSEVRDMSVGAKPHVDVEIRNIGKTPAYKASTVVGIGLQPFPLPEDADLNVEYPPDEFPNVQVIAPEKKLNLTPTLSIPLTVDHVAGISAGAVHFYIYGRGSYADAFGHPRKFTFCYVFRRNKKGVLAPFLYHDHNDAD